MSPKDSFEHLLHQVLSIKWPTAGLTVSGGTTAMNAKDSNIIDNLWNAGLQGLFADWSRQDTFTVIGFILTGISLKLAWESIKVNRARLAMEKEKNGN